MQKRHLPYPKKSMAVYAHRGDCGEQTSILWQYLQEYTLISLIRDDKTGHYLRGNSIISTLLSNVPENFIEVWGSRQERNGAFTLSPGEETKLVQAGSPAFAVAFPHYIKQLDVIVD